MASFRILLLIGVVLMLCKDIASQESLHNLGPASNFCSKDSKDVIVCDLTGTPTRVLESSWTEISGYSLSNAPLLIIQNQCKTESNEFFITNSINIRSEVVPRFANCTVYLKLVNCTADILSDIFSLINIKASTVNVIRIDGEQFDITDGSVVGTLDAKSNTDMSTIINSRVNVVTKMEIEGNHRLEISDSIIGELNRFIYDTTYQKEPSSMISNTEIGLVSSGGGFEMKKGFLVLNNVTFGSLSSESIILHGGELTLKDVQFSHVHEKGMVIKGPMKVIFENVAIGENIRTSLEITTIDYQDVWLLTLLYKDPQPLPLVGSIFIGIAVGLFLGVIFTLLYCKCCCSSFLPNRKEEENMQYPLTTVSPHSPDIKQPPPTPLVDHPMKEKGHDDNRLSECNYEDIDPPIPTQPNMLNPMDFRETQGKQFPPLPVLPPPHPALGNQQQVKTHNDFSLSQEAQNSSDDEPIYDVCYNESESASHPPIKPQSPPTKPSFWNKPKNSPAVTMTVPLPHKSVGRDDPAIDPLKGHQVPLLPKPAGEKPSFLHKTVKPPPPPRDKPTANSPTGNPLLKASKMTAGKGFGRLPLPPPPLTQSAFSNNLNPEEGDDLYEPVPHI